MNPKCVHTIRDLVNVECDSHGKIKKADRKNELQRADHLDCVRYAINTYEKDWIKRHQKQHGYGKLISQAEKTARLENNLGSIL